MNVLLDLPDVSIGSVGLGFCGGLLSDPPTRQPLPVWGLLLSEGGIRRGRLCGGAGWGPAAGQLLVVLVVHVQQLPWTY